MFWKFFVPSAAIAFLLGFPAAEFVIHGLDLSAWPSTVQRPSAWFSALGDSYGIEPIRIYGRMAFGQTNSIGPFGLEALGTIFTVPLLALVICFLPNYGPQRDPKATYGDARWATRKERDGMQIGVEVGLDPDNSRPVRVSTESHLLTIAPPRSGKTSGLIIPNLAAPDNAAWFGPAIVIDPKGDVFKAVAERRRQLGRVVRCLDPTSLVGGEDTWNPLANMNPSNILHLQRVARALLPGQTSGEIEYFLNKATDVIVGGFLAAHAAQRPVPAYVSWLLSNLSQFRKALKPMKSVAAAQAKAVLDMDPKGRDSILSTASQAFGWCSDPRLQKLTKQSSIGLLDLVAGNTDIFITLPAEDIQTLTPLLRWFFCELFAAVRRQRPREPIICFVDEAATLGKFDELVSAAGELPGHNLRLWTFWQDRSQINRLYGEQGGQTLLSTAEVVTYSDLSIIDPDEREFISRSIGEYTMIDRIENHDEKTGKKSISFQPRGVRLLTADGAGQIASRDHLVFLNSKRYPKRPMILRKTPYNDSRLSGHVVNSPS